MTNPYEPPSCSPPGGLFPRVPRWVWLTIATVLYLFARVFYYSQFGR